MVSVLQLMFLPFRFQQEQEVVQLPLMKKRAKRKALSENYSRPSFFISKLNEFYLQTSSICSLPSIFYSSASLFHSSSSVFHSSTSVFYSSLSIFYSLMNVFHSRVSDFRSRSSEFCSLTSEFCLSASIFCSNVSVFRCTDGYHPSKG